MAHPRYWIDKNIPIPALTSRDTGYGQRDLPNYPIPDMEIGDSFFVPIHHCHRKRLLERLAYHSKRRHLAFEVRAVWQGLRLEGHRVWLVGRGDEGGGGA